MNKLGKRIGCLLAVLVLAVSFCVPVFAAKKLPSLSSEVYIKTYTKKSSGKVYGYTDSTLKTQNSCWISCANDENRIIEIKGDAVKISYPLDSGGRNKSWFKRSDFTASDISGNLTYKTLSKRATTYKHSDGKVEYGYADKGDGIYVLKKSGDYTQIIYPISNGLWKMGWVKTSSLSYKDDTSTTSTTPFDPVWPAESSYTISCMYYYKDGTKHSCRYDYRYGMDISGSGNILAVEAGKVTTVENLGNKSFGRYIIITHDNGTKSLYAHLKSFNVSEGDTVKKGAVIGVMGSSGNSSGTHLHFELSDADPWKTYFKGKYAESMVYQQNVRNNNDKYNADDTIVKWIDDNCYKSGEYYYHN